MRYVNRRRLVIVAVLAALFGAALPYVEWAVSFWREPKLHREEEVYFSHACVTIRSISWCTEEFIIRIYEDPNNLKISEEDKTKVQNKSQGLISEGFFSSPLSWNCMKVTKWGWPFHGAYSCAVVHSKTVAQPTNMTRPMFYWLKIEAAVPRVLPRGMLWQGVIANMAIAILLAAIPFTMFSCIRARHRIKRGKCWKCGYLSNGAAVCPECGAGVKA